MNPQRTNSIGIAAHPKEVALADCMRKAQMGDKQAYTQLLVEVRPLLLRHAKSTLERMGLKDASMGEDLVQETLLAIHQKRATYDPTLPFTPWLFTIARYKLIDFGRRQRKTAPFHFDISDEFDLGEFLEWSLPDANSAASDVRSDLHGLLGTLPDRQRKLLEMVKLQGVSVAEASQQTGQSESSVKVNLHRALKFLRSKMKTEESDEAP